MRVFGRRPAALFVALAVAIGMTSCATIPDHGPVISGDVVNDDPLEGVFQLAPEGPKSGQTPVEVVRGFLAAAAGYSDDHAVARSFLSPERRLEWRPGASATVFRSLDTLSTRQLTKSEEAELSSSSATSSTTAAPGAEAASGGTPSSSSSPSASATTSTDADQSVAEVVVRAPAIAEVDGDGRYTVIAPKAKTEPHYFGLELIDGEWRISSLDDGILITRNDFNVTFKPYSVYFPDSTGDYLVPDTHWFASTPGSPELPTALTRALLEGPPDWMADAVTTTVPVGTEMAVAAVVVENSTATVDLTSPARQANDRERQLLLAQLETTLGQLRTISTVKITVDRVTYNIPEDSGPQPVVDPPVGGAAVGIDGKGRIVRIGIDGDEVVKGLDQLNAYDKSDGLISPAVSYDGSWFAALSADTRRLFVSEANSDDVVKLTGKNFTAPSFDPSGWLWTADASGVRAVDVAEAAASGVDQAQVDVEADWLDDYDVTAMRVSRDGTRAVLAISDHGTDHVFLAGIVRDEDGEPVRLTQPTGLVPDLVSVRDVAWVDEDHVAVLGRRMTGAANSTDESVQWNVDRPWVVELGGTIQPIAAVSGARTLTVGDGASTMVAGTAKGSQGRSGPSWAKISSARWPTFPG